MRALAPRVARRRAFTLVELMVVMAILGVLLGMGAAVFASASSGYQFRSAVAGAGTVVRSARNYAMARQSVATVIVEQRDDETRIVALGQRVVAAWHLESPPAETSGKHTLTIGGDKEYGRFGHCALLQPGQTIEGGKISKYAARDGVAIGGWFYGLGGGPDRQLLIDFGGQLVVRWESGGALSAQVGALETRTSAGVMPDSRWTHVEVVYDRTRLALFVDGVLQASKVGDDRPLETKGGGVLRIGGKKDAYAGLVDELTVAVVIRPEAQALPGDVQFVAGPSRLHFDRMGRLDPSAHAGAEALWFYSPDRGTWRRLEVSATGRVTIAEVAEGGPLPEKKKGKKSGTSSQVPGSN